MAIEVTNSLVLVQIQIFPTPFHGGGGREARDQNYSPEIPAVWPRSDAVWFAGSGRFPSACVDGWGPRLRIKTAYLEKKGHPWPKLLLCGEPLDHDIGSAGGA